MQKILLFILCTISFFSFSQPINDECSAAIEVIPSLDLTCTASVHGTILASTASPQGNTCNSYDDDDVWYKFVASSTMHKITLSNIVGSTIDMYFSVYTNPCDNSINQILCSDNNFSNVVGLIIGDTYYVRIYTKNNYANMDTQFDICITSPPLIPANNECSGAITMQVNQIGSCDSLKFGTINGATTSTQTNACTGSVFHDVWYRFVATHTAHVIKVNPLNESPVNYYHAVYQGTCGAIGARLKCSDLDSSVVTGLTVGQSYFIRLYSTSTVLEGIIADFSICLSLPPTPPINDECVNAIELIVNEDFECSNSTDGNVINALESNQASTCVDDSPIDPHNDVWYKFTATRTEHKLQIFNVDGVSAAIRFVAYKGNCTYLNTPILCNVEFNNGTYSLNNLIVGNEYLVRVFSDSDTPNQTTSFTLCIGSEPRPINDECSGAIELQVSLTNNYVWSDVILLYSTQSADTTDCASPDLADVWYKFTALDTSHVLNVTGVGGNLSTDVRYDLYKGNCNNFTTSIFCDRQYANQLNNLTIGDVYYLKVHALFDLSALHRISIKTNVIREANDECSNATLIDINSDLVCDTLYLASLLNATPSMYPSNSPSVDDDIWVKFKANNAIEEITINYSTSSNVYFTLYFYKSCNDLTHFDAVSYTNNYVLRNLIPDSLYYIRISSDNTAGIFSDPIELCLKKYDTPINDECVNAISAVVNNRGTCDSFTLGTITRATASVEGNTCGDLVDDDDVWFKFVAIDVLHYIQIYRISGSFGDPDFAVYSGDYSDLTQIDCYESSATLTGLIIGETYYIRVYSPGTTLNLTTNFKICIESRNIPTNDECINSILIPETSSTICPQNIWGDLIRSTPSSQPNSCTITNPDDVWFHFVVTNPTLEISIPSGLDLAYSIYRKNCDSIGDALYCVEGPSTADLILTAENLTVGDTLFMRVYEATPTDYAEDFYICIKIPFTYIIPPNDECLGAIEIPTNNSFACDTLLNCSVTSGVSESAGTTCYPTMKDVWYKFVATNNDMEIQIRNSSGTLTPRTVTLFAGNCDSLGNELYCGNITRFSNLIVGNTYYLRTYGVINTNNLPDVFSICLKKYFVLPNDECINAIEVPVNHNYSCDSSIHGTLFHASTSPAGTHCGVVPVNDAWFKFVATSTKHTYNLYNKYNGGNTMNFVYISIYNGNCGALGTPIMCTNSSIDGLTNLIIGNTYYIRVFNSNTTSNLALEFDLCIYIPQPPVNDECVNATLIQREVDNSCTITTAGTLNNATTSIQANSCSNTSDDDDVWYKFVASSPDHAVNLLNVLGNTDLYHSVYSGSCQALQNLSCNDPNSSVINGLTVDSTYYVRVYSTSVLAQSTTFKICAGPYLSVPSCIDNTPAGNDCESATAICDFNGYCGRTSGFYTTESWLEFDTTFCGTIENNSFLSFVPDSDSLALNVWVTSSVTNLGIQVFIFDAENCGGPVQNLACWDPNYVPPGHKQITASGLIPGHKYYMMIDGQGGDICDYVFGSDASISSPITISPQQVDICLGDSVLLTASGGDGTFEWNPSSDITLVAGNSIYFKPSHLDSNRVRVSSFTNSSSCGPNSEIEYQINVRSCVCPIIASNNSDSCVSNAFDLFVSDVFGGSYEWQDANGVISNVQNPTAILTPQIAGSHIYTVTATSGTESCSAQTIVTINEIPDANFTFSDTAFCQFSTNPFPQIEGMQGGVFSANTFDTEVNPISGEINLSNTLIGSYQITYTTPGVCPQSKSLEIDVINLPSAQAVSDQTICFGSSFSEINFIGSLGSQFSWTNSNPSIGLAANGNGNIGSFTPTLDNQQAEITLTPSNLACVGTPIAFNLNVLEKVSLDSIPNQTVCLNDNFQEIVFSGSNATTFSWTNSNPSIGLATNGSGTIASFQSLTGNEEAIIEVQASNEFCSGEIRSFSLFVNSLPEVTLEDFDTICNQNNPFELFGGLPEGGTYSGDSIVDNFFIPFYFFIANVEITYTYTDPLSYCTNSATSSINIQHCESIEENSLASLFKIYPNPSSGLVTIESTEQFNFELIDAVGKVVKIGNQSSILNLENYAQGVYELKIKSKKGNLIYKLVRN